MSEDAKNDIIKMVFCCPEGRLSGTMFCQIVIDIVHQNVAKPFTYTVPDGMQLEPGQRVTVPFGSGRKEGIVTALTEEAPPDLAPKKIRAVIGPLEDYTAVPPELMTLAAQMSEDAHCPLAETLRLMIPAQMRGGRVHIKTERIARLAVSREAAEAEIAADKRNTKRSQLLAILMDGEPRTVTALAEYIRDPNAVLKKLSQDGFITLAEKEVLRIPGAEDIGTGPDFELTPGQQEALEEILPSLRGKPGKFLIHGVTGSGKTEVFMAAVRTALSLGKGAIILVPEIALTPQMVAWFRNRFGPVAAVIHSRLSAGERYDEWRRIRRGEARVVIGARSAVFSPVKRLGLIVVDEEHEGSYYSDRHPQYDARDVAAKRCENEGATMILASATPSILSFARARRGDYILLEMPERANGRPLPNVELIDMREELETGNRSIFSRALTAGLKECLHRGEQAMLLINRRGYHSFVSCRSCGTVIRCPHCDISLTYHEDAGRGRLKCHYCGYETPSPQTCPACGSRYIKFFGTGTQQVEAEVRKLFPDTTTVRMDTDTTSGKDGHRTILETFRSGRARVLIGTQMIAKGLDFPQVTLVGVIAADMSLNLPDYRSRERTFQLLTQVAGRAGRGRMPGQVIIQTYRPEDPVLNYAAKQDFRSFFEDEFQRRRNGLYPPFTIMARILAESGREESAENASYTLEKAVDEMIEEHREWKQKVLLIQRDIPPVKMLRGRHRRQILMKLLVSREADRLLAAVTNLCCGEYPETEVWLEVNPANMM